MLLKTTSVVVLAAGYSSRMGQPKFGLKMPDGTTFIEKIIGQYRSFGCIEIVVVMNKDGIQYLKRYPIDLPENVFLAINEYPDRKRFYSLQCGLKLIKSRNNVFIHNADNPFAEYSVLEKLTTNLSEFDFAKPINNFKGGHPVLINHIMVKKMMAADYTKWTIRDFLETHSGKSVDVESKKIHTNINTPGAYNDSMIQ